MRETPFTIREANRTDAGSIAAVCAASWRAGFEGLLPERVFDGAVEARQASGLDKSLGGGDTDGYVAQNESGIVGFVMLRAPLNDSEMTDWGQISALYVDPQFWRRGVGNALCNTALYRARERCMRGVLVWTLDANRRAVEFFKQAGFVSDGEFKHWPRDGAVDTESRLLHEFGSP